MSSKLKFVLEKCDIKAKNTLFNSFHKLKKQGELLIHGQVIKHLRNEIAQSNGEKQELQTLLKRTRKQSEKSRRYGSNQIHLSHNHAPSSKDNMGEETMDSIHNESSNDYQPNTSRIKNQSSYLKCSHLQTAEQTMQHDQFSLKDSTIYGT
jgi:hypothetical protein